MEKDSPIEKFFLGCETGDLKLIREALKEEFVAAWPSHNPKYISQGTHGLGVAAFNGHLNVVKYILTSPEMKKNPEPNRELYTPKGQEPMVLAFQNGHLEIVNFLLEEIINKYNDPNGVHYDEYFDFAFTEEQNELAKYLISSTNLLESFHPNFILESTCRTDNVPLFKYLLSSKDLKINAKIDEDALEFAFRKNSKHILNAILNAPKLSENPKVILNLIELSCKYDNLDVIAHLVNSPKLQIHADIDLVLCLYSLKDKDKNPLKYIRELFGPKFQKHPDPDCGDGSPLINACAMGTYDVIQYLTSSPTLKKHANPNNTMAIANACAKNNWDVVKYLLDFSYIKEHPETLKSPEKIFVAAYDSRNALIYNALERRNFLKFLIFDLKLEKSSFIAAHMAENPDQEIEKMFKIRDAEQLDLTLSHKNDDTKTKKNKI